MSRMGADAGQLDVLAMGMATNAQAIEAVVARASALLDSVWWEGEDARVFREEWTYGEAQLRQLTSALAEAGVYAGRAAEQQRGASQ